MGSERGLAVHGALAPGSACGKGGRQGCFHIAHGRGIGAHRELAAARRPQVGWSGGYRATGYGPTRPESDEPPPAATPSSLDKSVGGTGFGFAASLNSAECEHRVGGPAGAAEEQ